MISDAALASLESQVDGALASGDESAIRVLGYGEISVVIGWPAGEPTLACKRLPPFPDRPRFQAYADALLDYVEALRRAGVGVLPTEVRHVERADGTVAAYAIQPVVPAEALAPGVLAQADPRDGHPMIGRIVEATVGATGPGLGIDAQLSNWTWDGVRLGYFDVTTPLIWWADGRPRLDVAVLVTALPWVLRTPVKRFVAPGIIRRYQDPRATLLDLGGNLLKERLEQWLPAFVAAANARVKPELTVQECRKYYAGDARLWSFLLRIRRMDRWWQRRIRRRSYGHLLPREIER